MLTNSVKTSSTPPLLGGVGELARGQGAGHQHCDFLKVWLSVPTQIQSADVEAESAVSADAWDVNILGFQYNSRASLRIACSRTDSTSLRATPWPRAAGSLCSSSSR